MSTITLTNTLTNGTVADADDLMENLEDITTVVNGSIDEDNIDSTADITLNSLTTDTISENTSAAGVTIDGIQLKDDLDTSGIVTKATTQTLTGKKTMGAVVQTATAYSPDAAGTATLTVNLGNLHKITMPAGNITIAVSGETTNQFFILEILQDGIGSRTVTWFDTITWAGGSAPTLTTTASKTDVFGFRVTGTDTYWGCVVAQNI